MTSDAKIGLLLGLVFIFVIAFIINGLPTLQPRMGKAEVPLNQVDLTSEELGDVAGRTQKAIDWPMSSEPQGTAGETAQVVAQDVKPVVQEPQQPQTAGHEENVRSSYPLSAIGNLLDQLTTPAPKERVVTVDLDLPQPVTEAPGAAARSSASAASPAKSEPKAEPRPVDMVARVIGTLDVPKAAASSSAQARGDSAARQSPPKPEPGSKIYVVAEGDNLASIAKKVYGPEEGNRVVNIQRIFQANQVLLKSAHEVFVGQKLVIPPLPKAALTPAPSTPRPADVLPNTHFENVDAVGKRAAAAMPAPIPDGRWYTVQDGDSLWKIAASQLGSGARCDEIYKLNAEILKSKDDTLGLGMKLRLPAK